MMFAAPEFVISERVELLDKIEVAAELQHRMLADGVMRGEEGAEFEARHGFLSGRLLLLGCSAPNYGVGRAKAIAEAAVRPMRHGAMRAADGSPRASGCRPQRLR